MNMVSFSSIIVEVSLLCKITNFFLSSRTDHRPRVERPNSKSVEIVSTS
jgi:hypothetical protein